MSIVHQCIINTSLILPQYWELLRLVTEYIESWWNPSNDQLTWDVRLTCVFLWPNMCWDRHLLRVGKKGIIVFVPKNFHGKVGVQFDQADQGHEGFSNAQSGVEGRQGTKIEWCYCMLPFLCPVFNHTTSIWHPWDTYNAFQSTNGICTIQSICIFHFQYGVPFFFCHWDRISELVFECC